MKHVLRLAAALSAALAITTPAATAQDSVSADTVVARVGEAEITLGHVLVMRAQLPDRVLQLEDEVLFEGIVDQLIDQHLLGQSLDEGNLPDAIALQFENETRGARASAALALVLDAAVSDTALQTAYDAAFDEAEPTLEYNARHILLDEEADALAVIEELEGGADFAEVAGEKSTGPSGPNGGELGWFGEGRMIPEFYDATAALEVGETSAPIKSEFGWHVINLTDTREIPVPTLEQVKANLAQQLQQEAVEARIGELREAASPELLIEGIDPAALRDDSLLEN